MVFDGPDGSGKSTQQRRFMEMAQSVGVEVCEVREPGGTDIGEMIRKVLLDPRNKEEIELRCEMLLFMASRAQLVSQKIRPALRSGCLVLADRFISSTLAYQGAAAGLPIDDIIRVGQIAVQECWPDLVVIFDVDPATAQSRTNPQNRKPEFGRGKDRMETKGPEFHRKVRQGYLDQVHRDPGRHLLINGAAEPDAVFAQLLQFMQQRVTEPGWRVAAR